MPLTPFMGLSIIIHVAIIVGHVILNRVIPSSVAYRSPKDRPIFAFCASCLVIFTIVGIIFMNGWLLVMGSITEKHSTVNLASNYYDSTVNFQLLGTDAIIEIGSVNSNSALKKRGTDLASLSLTNALPPIAFFPETWLRTGHKLGGILTNNRSQ